MKMVAQVETRTQQGFIEKLKEKGLKPTSERLLIFKEATKLPHHFSADELAFKVWQKDERVSRATVYRTIPLLLEFGVLREVVFSDKHHNYECVLGKAHHEHLICLKCGKIIEFSDDRMETPLDEACEKFNFKAVAHKTEVTGYCKNCH
jgi:Fur family ferric uptake transcriptional regulator